MLQKLFTFNSLYYDNITLLKGGNTCRSSKSHSARNKSDSTTGMSCSIYIIPYTQLKGDMRQYKIIVVIVKNKSKCVESGKWTK